jgi:hypothetical protein
VLTNGHVYQLRLREDINVPRWVFGTIEERLPPYNLPPIAITVDGGIIFTFDDFYRL